MVDKSYANNFLGQIHKKKKKEKNEKQVRDKENFHAWEDVREGTKKRCIHQTTTERLNLSDCN